MEESSNQHFRNQAKVLCFGTINFSDYQGLEVPGSKNVDGLSQEVQNSAMKDPVNGKKLNVEGGPMALKDGVERWRASEPEVPHKARGG